MAKRQIFYSFHYSNDVFRVQQIRNMGVLDGNPPASTNDWEEVKRGGDSAIKRWIDDSMYYRSCVVVLIGSETANRKWVKYEIEKAWNEGKGLFGIYIHNLKCPISGTTSQGTNPFEQVPATKGRCIKCYNPNNWDAYNDIRNNIEQWIEDAINQRTIDNIIKSWGL
jgi:hypothetical protein